MISNWQERRWTASTADCRREGKANRCHAARGDAARGHCTKGQRIARKVPEPLIKPLDRGYRGSTEMPSPRLPAPPALSQPLAPLSPLAKEMTRSNSARTFTSVSTQSIQPSTKALLLAKKQAHIAQRIDEDCTVLRQMFRLEKVQDDGRRL